MPELPEVETIVRGLNEKALKREIKSIEILDPKLEPGCGPCVKKLKNRELVRVNRFGKYLEFVFDDQSRIVAHLRMTGKFVFLPADEACQKRHLRLIIKFKDRTRLAFFDPRRFGTLVWYPAGVSIPEKQRVGPDPLESGLSPAGFHQIITGLKQEIKLAILRQDKISGLGNIYASEALFAAGINPRRASRLLSPAETKRLFKHIQAILREAIKHNGTSISDFRGVDDKTGSFQDWLQVYDRAGEACRKCSTPIRKIRQGQRSTFFCPRCQPEPEDQILTGAVESRSVL